MERPASVGVPAPRAAPDEDLFAPATPVGGVRVTPVEEPAPVMMAPGPGPRRRIPPAARRGAAVVVAAGSALALATVTAQVMSAPSAQPANAALTLNATGAPAEQQPTFTPGPLLDTTAVNDMVTRARQQADTHVATQQAAEQQAAAKRAAEQQAAATRATRTATSSSGTAATTPAGGAHCGLATGGLGGVKPWVTDAAEFLGCLFGRPQMLGVGGRGNVSDHPTGLAVDFMVTSAVGDRLAACALRNKAALGITYVIWQQRINYGSGWKAMEDRGSATANHMDHVHVSFAKSAPAGRPVAC